MSKNIQRKLIAQAKSLEWLPKGNLTARQEMQEIEMRGGGDCMGAPCSRPLKRTV